jgi:hypothetical protein
MLCSVFFSSTGVGIPIFETPAPPPLSLFIYFFLSFFLSFFSMTPGRYHRKNRNKNWGRSLWSVKDSDEDQAPTQGQSLGPIPIKPLAEDFTPNTKLPSAL